MADNLPIFDLIFVSHLRSLLADAKSCMMVTTAELQVKPWQINGRRKEFMEHGENEPGGWRTFVNRYSIGRCANLNNARRFWGMQLGCINRIVFNARATCDLQGGHIET